MLTVRGRSGHAFCDGVSRRNFLSIGSLTFGGMTLAHLLRAEELQGRRQSHKAVIMVFLPGGPPHLDMFDLKPAAPVDIRGEFRPIQTNVAGIEICELMPRMAAVMDRLAIVRSIVETPHDHAAFHCLTGRSRIAPQPLGGWPALGAVASKLKGPVHPSMPPFVGLTPEMRLKEWADPGSPGFLGLSHAPFQPRGDSLEDMVCHGITLDCLRDRRALQAGFDRFRRDVDQSGLMRGMDAHNAAAFEILTSPRLVHALDLSREDPKILEAYGEGGPPLHPTSKDKPDATGDLRHFLMARRLVEAARAA